MKKLFIFKNARKYGWLFAIGYEIWSLCDWVYNKHYPKKIFSRSFVSKVFIFQGKLEEKLKKIERSVA